MVAVLLIHDLGNVVKFDLESKDRKKVLVDEKDVEYWKMVQKDTISKYGAGEHEATENMAKELGIDKELQSLLGNMGRYEGANMGLTREEDFEVRICAYSDLRVAPYGVTSALDRLDDLIYRYRGREKESVFRDMLDVTPKQERALFKNVSIKPEQITEESISNYLAEFENRKTYI